MTKASFERYRSRFESLDCGYIADLYDRVFARCNYDPVICLSPFRHSRCNRTTSWRIRKTATPVVPRPKVSMMQVWGVNDIGINGYGEPSIDGLNL